MKSGGWASTQKKDKKDKTERAMGVDRKTREEIVKRNQMTALRLQTGGRGAGDGVGSNQINNKQLC